MKPPYPPPMYLLLGRDAEGIGAVVFYEELDGPSQVEVWIGAVALRYRRRGGGWADEMMSMVLDSITSRALETGVDIVEVGTMIDEGNRASQAMCRRFGLRQVAQREDGMQRWAAYLMVGGAEL